MNISGDFETTQKEIDCVTEIFKQQGIDVLKIRKNPKPDDGDVLVTLKNGRVINIEVKEESNLRFEKYGDLGIDFISVFYFKHNALDWKGSPKSPKLLNRFYEDIDNTRPFKYGKLFYSKSDLWLFFVKDSDKFVYCEFFDGKAMVSEKMRHYLAKNCSFAINNKPYWQLSHEDTHNSAVFFINHNNKFLNQFKIDLKKFTAL